MPLTRVGSYDRWDLYAWVRDHLLPKLGRFPAPRSVLIMDGFGSHKYAPLLELLRGCGVITVLLPPYSPWLNPAELWFAMLKKDLRRTGARLEPDHVARSVYDVVYRRRNVNYRGAIIKAGYGAHCS